MVFGEVRKIKKSGRPDNPTQSNGCLPNRSPETCR